MTDVQLMQVISFLESKKEQAIESFMKGTLVLLMHQPSKSAEENAEHMKKAMEVAKNTGKIDVYDDVFS